MRLSPLRRRRSLTLRTLALASAWCMASGATAIAQSAPSPLSSPPATVLADEVPSADVTATDTSKAPPDANSGFVLPTSSTLEVWWRIVDQLGMVFLRSPLSSTLFGLDNQGPYADPRGEQVVTPAVVDLEGAIADPTWFKENAKLQAADAQYISAYSTSMARDIPLVWVPAPDSSAGPRPVVYTLDGLGGGVYGSYVTGTELIERARELNVHLLLPAQGAKSNYLDWYDDSAVAAGRQQWETFLSKELPGPLNAAIGANGRQSIVGMSMSGGSVFILAAHNPGLYDAVGGISGCGESASLITRGLQQAVLRDLGSVEDLYGPAGGDVNRYNDSLSNVRALEGTPLIYNFNGGGLLGEQDLDPRYSPTTTKDWRARILNGAVIEWATNACAHRMESALKTAGIPATFEYATAGAHNWGIFTQGTNRFMQLVGEKVYPAAVGE